MAPNLNFEPFDLRTDIRDNKGHIVKKQPYRLRITKTGSIYQRGENYFYPNGECMKGPLKLEHDALYESELEARQILAEKVAKAAAREAEKLAKQERAVEELDASEKKNVALEAELKALKESMAKGKPVNFNKAG